MGSLAPGDNYEVDEQLLENSYLRLKNKKQKNLEGRKVPKRHNEEI